MKPREISQEEYDKLQPKKLPSLMDDNEKRITAEIVKRLNRRPIRFDVVYDGMARIKSVIPIYKEVEE